MKPVLLKSIKDYPKSGLGRIVTATNQNVHQVINGDYTFSFDMLIKDRLYPKIDDEMIIATSVSKTDTDFFIIKTIDTKNPGTVTVTCNQITMLTNEDYVRGKLTIDGKTVKQVLSEMTSKLDLPGQTFTYSTDIDQIISKTDITYTNSNPGQILIGDSNSLVNVLDARLVRQRTSLMLTNKNTNHYIDLRYGKNIAGVSINRNTNNLVTSIVPFFNMKSKEVATTNTSTDDSNTNADGWTIRAVNSEGVVTVKSGYALVYNDKNQEISRRLYEGTSWKTSLQRTKAGIYQFKVATNQWLLSTDVSFDGTLGSVVSQPETPIKPIDTVPEDQLQYGPEVYSLQYDPDRPPHRKYVDYSSRVDNIPDLIDLSQNYFIENSEIDKPTYTIDIDVSNSNQKRMFDIQIGDIARIWDPKYGISSDETIIERSFNPDLMVNTSLKAGSWQQTIFRYLDKRISDASDKTDALHKQSNSNINDAKEDTTNKINQVQVDLNQQLDDSEKKAQQIIADVKTSVSNAQTSITNFMNSGGNNKIRWIPTLAEATQMEITTDYGYLLIDDHGVGFHNNDGTVITGMAADGHFYADKLATNELTSTVITNGTLNNGEINSAVINSGKFIGGSILTKHAIQVENDNGNVSTSIANYGISTPNLTVTQIDGAHLVQSINLNISSTANIKFLHILSGGNIYSDGGLYVQGPLYVSGKLIAS